MNDNGTWKKRKLLQEWQVDILKLAKSRPIIERTVNQRLIRWTIYNDDVADQLYKNSIIMSGMPTP